MKKTILLPVFFLLMAVSADAQFNAVYLDHIGLYNSLSIDSASGLIVIGRAAHADYMRNEKQLQIKGTRAFIQKNPDVILTYTGVSDYAGMLYVYSFEGELKEEIPFKGVISALTATPGQHVVYLTVNTKIDALSSESAVYSFDISTRQVRLVFLSGVYELTSISLLQGNRLGISGTQMNYIISLDGKVIKEIPAPHRSFSKANRQHNLFMILQEFSDGSILEFYNADGAKLRTIDYKHKKKPFQGTRRCRECKTKNASFEDYDLSPDQQLLLARDQYNQVFVLDEHIKLKMSFEDSQDWCFLTWVSNTEFMYLDKKTNEIKRKTLQK